MVLTIQGTSMTGSGHSHADEDAMASKIVGIVFI